MSDSFKVYVTKYALTQGIFEGEAEICHGVSEGMIELLENKNFYFHGEGREWHRTKESAIKRAEEMRNRGIIKLEKKIQKLKEMKFE